MIWLVLLLLGAALGLTLAALGGLWWLDRQGKRPHVLDLDRIYRLGDRNA